MEIKSLKENGKLTIEVIGKVDTTTAPQLDKYIADNSEGITDLVIDLKEMPYISSAGLRVLLKTSKKMNQKGSMMVVNVTDEAMEIFEITGFNEILDIK